MRKLHVFVSGPYTIGDPVVNVRAAIKAADILLANGHWPYIPHLTHLWHLISPHEYDQWIELDKAWLSKCDVMLRMPGASVGADLEALNAKDRGIPVYYGIGDLLEAHGCPGWTDESN